jgi:hypothetical protein
VPLGVGGCRWASVGAAGIIVDRYLVIYAVAIHDLFGGLRR